MDEDYDAQVPRCGSAARGQEFLDNRITAEKKKNLVTIGGAEWTEAEDGIYIAEVTKVDMNYSFKGNRKLVFYFTITDEIDYPQKRRAQLFYNKLSLAESEDRGTDFPPGCKFYDHIKKLFPHVVSSSNDPVEIDPVDLFTSQKYFQITVERRGEGGIATVQHIEIAPPF